MAYSVKGGLYCRWDSARGAAGLLEGSRGWTWGPEETGERDSREQDCGMDLQDRRVKVGGRQTQLPRFPAGSPGPWWCYDLEQESQGTRGWGSEVAVPGEPSKRSRRERGLVYTGLEAKESLRLPREYVWRGKKSAPHRI